MSIEMFRNIVEQVGLVIDAVGVLVVVIGICIDKLLEVCRCANSNNNCF